MHTVDLRTARERRRLDQKTLSQLSGVGQYTISKLENGVTTNPTLGTVRKLERALGLKRVRLVFGQEAEAVSA